MTLFESSIFTPREQSNNVFTPTGPNDYAELDMGLTEHLKTEQEVLHLHRKKKSTPLTRGAIYNQPMT